MGITHFVRRCVSGALLLLRMIRCLNPGSPNAVTAYYCALCVTTGLAGAEELRKHYSLPSGDAVTTLRQFATDSGEQIVYMVDNVRGERTNAVKGKFASREALERMLAGTRLIAAQDPKTGALVVGRKRIAPPGEAVKSLKKNDTSNSQTPRPMKTNRLLSRLAATLALLVSPITHADVSAQPTAELRGRVSNRATGDNLGNAIVRIEGTSHVAYTERDGSYILRNLPPGQATVRVTYPGLDAASANVDLSPAAIARQDFALVSDIYVLPEYTVAGSREGNALAIARQERASTVLNSVSSDAFGSISQNNIANVLRRLPGIVGEMTAANVSSISVRGMDEQHTVVSIDGTAGAGASQFTDGIGDAVYPTGRASLPLGSVPAEFIESVEVVKTPTADMDADSLGGSINLKTKSAYDSTGRLLKLTVGSNYNLTHGSKVDANSNNKSYIFPSLQLVYGDVYDVLGNQNNLGLLLTAKHYVSPEVTGVTQVDPAADWDFEGPTLPERILFPTSLQFSRNESTSFNVKLDYKLWEKSKISLSAGYTNYKRFKDDSRPRLDGGTRAVDVGPILSESSDTLWVFRNQQQVFLRQIVLNEVETWRWNVQGDHRLESAHITWDLTYSPSRQEDSWMATQNIIAADLISFNWDRSNFDKPVFIQTGGRDIRENNMDNVTRFRAFARDDIMTHDVFGARLDVEKHFGDSSIIPLTVKAGLRYRQEERDLNQNRFDSEAFPTIGRDFSTYVDPTFTYDWPGGLPNTYIPDTRRFFADAGIRYVPEGAPDNPVLPYVYDPAVVQERNSIRDSSRNDWVSRDGVSAVFLQGEFELARELRMTAGIRFERTKVTLTTPFEDLQAPPPVERWTSRRTFRTEYDNVFPNLQFRYEPWKRVIFRAAYSTTIGRPKIADLAPRMSANEVTEVVSFGNAALKPQEGKNIDLSVEYYFEPVGVLSLGVFRKKLNNFVAPASFIITGNEYDMDLSEFVGWEGRTKENVGNGTVEGLEFNYSQQFSFLPGRWRGLGVFFNWTALTSSGDFGEYNPPPNIPLKNVLPKFRPESGNVGISYAYGRWDLRLMWNYVAAYLEFPDFVDFSRSLYRGSRDQFDFFATYQLTPRFQIYLDLINIGPENDRAYFGKVAPARQRDTFWLSTMLSTGVKMSF